MPLAVPYVYFNGEILPENAVKIDPKDRGFLLGDGLFETLQVYQNKILFLEQHWQRFTDGLRQLKIPNSLTIQQLEQIIHQLITFNQFESMRIAVRLTITRGTAPRGVLPPSNPVPTVLINASPLKHYIDKPYYLITSTITRNENSPLTQIKSTNYLENILAQQHAAELGADDAILLNNKNYIAETTVANIFIVKDNIIKTPLIKDGALPGIIRHNIIKLCKTYKMMITETNLTLADLYTADEIFITNSLIHILKIHKIDQHLIPTNTNSLTDKLKQLFDNETL